MLPAAAAAAVGALRLYHGEAVPGAQGVVLCALEPALVANLHLQQVQVAVGDGGGDQLVAAALIAVGGAGQDLELQAVGRGREGAGNACENTSESGQAGLVGACSCTKVAKCPLRPVTILTRQQPATACCRYL